MTRKKIQLIFLWILLPFIHFNNPCSAKNQADTTINISGTNVDIKFPVESVYGCILVLPGWNFTQDDICAKSEFCKLFTNSGFILIMPNMLKSIYTIKTYEETRNDWLKYPTLKWVTDSLIAFIQNRYKRLLIGQNNYVFGISTGGRGVAMVLEQTGTLFKAGAALSGDYNQLLDLNDNLMIGYLGNFKQFPDRWTNDNNPFNNASKIKSPLYLAHGEADKIVPVDQTKKFYSELIRINPALNHKLKLNPQAGHSYEFWESEYLNVLEYFKVNSNKQ